MPTRSETTPTSYTAETGAPVPEKASLLEDFIDVFYAPSKVFGRREHQGFWPYVLIISVVGAVFTFASRALMSAAMDGEFARRMARMQAERPEMTEAQVSAARTLSEGVASFSSYLGMPVLLFLVAVLVWLAGKVVSAKLDFTRAMVISCIAQIPRLLGALITAIYGLTLADVSVVNGPTRLSYGPARFFDPDTANAGLVAVLFRFDLFTLWVTVLLGIGIAVIGKVPRARGFAAAALIWAVPTVIAGVGALFS